MNAAMQLLAAIPCTVLVVGCASGPTPQFPATLDPATSATITLARNTSPLGSAIRTEITLDGFIIAHLNISELITFSVPPGTHSIGPRGHTITLQFDPNQQYYLWISPSRSGDWEVERLLPDDARRRMAGFLDLTPGQPRSP